MKNLISLFLSVLFSCSILLAQNQPEEKHLLGQCSRTQLEEAPYNEWYQEEYEAYQPNTLVMEKLHQHKLAEYDIRIFFGSWCGDSQREIPRFLRILDELGVRQEKVEMVGLDKGNQYKQSPGKEEEGQGIFRVPVFILEKEGKEVGRIVEYPVESLERDLLAIVEEKPYTPNYFSYPYIIKWQKEGVLSDPNVNLRGLAKQLKNEITHPGELNAAGYVMLHRNELEEAIRVFQLNTLLYPGLSNSYDSLGEAYAAAGQTENALRAYGEALSLDPENQRLQQTVEELRAKTTGK